MYKLLPLSLILAIVFYSPLSKAVVIDKATSISKTNISLYQGLELSNSKQLKVLKNLITTKINDPLNPLRIKANFDGITGKSGSVLYHYGYLELLSGSTFSNNTASVDGGAIYITDTSGRVNIYNTQFKNNSAGMRGGAIYAKETPLNLFGGSSFYNNSAKQDGGAIYTLNGILNFNTEAGDISFLNNTADNMPNDIAMEGNSILNINGHNAVILDGGINNIGNKDYTNTIINNNSTLDINTAKVYAGNINFGSNSALYVKIKDNNSYGQIFAKNINIASGSKLKITVAFAASNQNDSFVAEILNASDNLNGNFTLLPNITDNELYDITYLDGGRYQISKKPSTDSDNNQDSNNESSSKNHGLKPDDAWLNNGSFKPGSSAAETAEYLYDLKQTNPQAYENALKALTPASHQLVQNAISQINKQILSAVSSQLSGGNNGLSAGKSAGDNLFRRSRSWVKILTNRAKFSGNDGFSSNSNGISMGVDKLVSDNLRLGIGYAYSNGTIDSFQRNTDLNTHTAIIYGEYKPSKWFINSIVAYNHSNYQENKMIPGFPVKSDYDVDSLNLQVMSGVETGLFTPQIGLRYAYFQRGHYQDTAGQNIKANNSQTLTTVLGSKISKDFIFSPILLFQPEFKLAVTYDILTNADNTLVSLPNGAAYETATKHTNPLGFELAGSFNFNLMDCTNISLGYEGRFRKNYQEHSGILDIKYNF